MIYFLTGNKGKLYEATEILGAVQELDIDLPEIQDLDPHEVIKAKLKEAQQHHQGEFMVEDTSLSLEAIRGLPGTLIKWFLKSIGTEGIFKLADNEKNYKANALCVIGYSDKSGKTHFFEGRVEGTIVSPRGDSNFGWDPIFVPTGHSKTYAEMGNSEKNQISHRRMALDKLKKYLDNIEI